MISAVKFIVNLAIPKEDFEEYKRRVLSFFFESDNPLFTAIIIPGLELSDDPFLYAKFESESVQDIWDALYMLPEGSLNSIKV